MDRPAATPLAFSSPIIMSAGGLMTKVVLRALASTAIGAAVVLAVAPAASATQAGPYNTRSECEEVRVKYMKYNPTPCNIVTDPWESQLWVFYY
jgi:hypothetical protein